MSDFKTGVLFLILFTIVLFQIYYLHVKEKDKPVSDLLEKYYLTVNMIFTVFISILIIGFLFDNDTQLEGKIILILMLCGILTILLYPFIIINEGKQLNKGIIIAQLVFYYMMILNVGMYVIKFLVLSKD